jgi:pimeloyl-ACP methyl ester carboxylesterase
MPSPDSAPLRTREATVDGVPQRWRESGEGYPAILLHGFPTSPALWRGVHQHLDGVRAIAWEMTGYGESVPAGEGRDLGIDPQADRLLSLMDHLGLEEALLVGHDVGGGVAQVAATQQPHRLSGLVLADAVCYDAWPAEPVRRIARAGDVLAALPDRALKPLVWGAWVRAHATEAQARQAWSIHWPSYGEYGGTAALVRQARALDVADTVDVADALPSLADKANRVVWGARDPFLEPAWGARLAAALGAPFDEVEGASHFVPESHPERVAAAIQDAATEARKGD